MTIETKFDKFQKDEELWYKCPITYKPKKCTMVRFGKLGLSDIRDNKGKTRAVWNADLFKTKQELLESL